MDFTYKSAFQEFKLLFLFVKHLRFSNCERSLEDFLLLMQILKN